MVINADLSIAYLYARRYDEAEAQASKTLEIDPRSFLAHYYLGMALQLKGRLEKAIPEFQKAVELNHDPYCISILAQGYARNGQTDEARKLLRSSMKWRSPPKFPSTPSPSFTRRWATKIMP